MTNNSSRKPYHFLLAGGGSVSTIGGVVRFFRDLSENLSQKGYQVTILANGHPGNEPFYQYDQNVRLIFMKYPHSFRKAWQFGRVAELLDPDAVVVKFSNFVGLPAMMGLVDRPFPILRAEHGNPDHILETIWKGDARQRELSFLGADRVHLLSEDYVRRQPLPAFVRERTFVISSPVTPATRFAQPSGDPGKVKRVIYSGRIETYEKNSMLLLDAFLPLQERFSDWNLEFFGDGDLRPEMEARCRALGILGTRVHFHGSVPLEKLVENYASAHLFAFPSDTEGAPIALGEALAHGLPSIGFADCTGTNERILHEENGLLVEASSDNAARASALSAAMAGLMANDNLRQRMGDSAIRSAERYRPDVIFDRWESELCHLAAQKPYVAKRRARDKAEAEGEASALYALARSLRRKSAVSTEEDQKFVATIRAQPQGASLPEPPAALPRWKRLFSRLTKKRIPGDDGPLVSIVIPAYNKGPVLAKTVKSALAQSGIRREVLVIDDGSSDNSGKILERLENAEGLRIFRRCNQGVGSARNFGLNQARGKYLLFWDADDVLEPGAIAEIAEVAERRKADITVGALYHFKHGKAARWMRPPFWLMRERKAGEASNIRDDILLRYDVSAANKLFRRNFLVENDICYKETIRLEDILFSWVAHLAAERVTYSGVTLGGYRKFGRNGLLVTGSASWSELKLSSVPIVFRALQSITQNEKGDFKPDIDIYFLSVFVAALQSIYAADWSNEKRAHMLDDYRACISEVDPSLISLLPNADQDLLVGLLLENSELPRGDKNAFSLPPFDGEQLALPRLIRLLESYPTQKKIPLDADWEWFARHHVQECLLLPTKDQFEAVPMLANALAASRDKKVAASGIG